MQFFDVFYFILLPNEVSQMQLLEHLKLSWYVIRPFTSQWITIKSTLFLSTNHDKTHWFDVSTFWMFLGFLLQNNKCNSHIRESPVKLFSNTVQERVSAKTQFNHRQATLKCSVRACRVSQRFVWAAHTLTKSSTFSSGWQCCNSDTSKTKTTPMNSQCTYWKGTNCLFNFLQSFIQFFFPF